MYGADTYQQNGIKMGRKLLGVYIPTYNREKELKQCLDSFIPQLSKYGFPIFISDNGSTDGTKNVVKDAQKRYKNVFYRRNPKNLGYGPNLIKVLRMGNTKYAWIFGDDDTIEKGAIDAITSNLNVDTSFIQINSSICSNDLSKKIQKRLISDTHDTIFLRGDHSKVLLNALNGYAGYMAELIVRKDLLDHELSKLNLKSTPLDFIHSILFFRSIVGKKGIYLSKPMIRIRAFNISYSGRPFDVWLNKYPRTINLFGQNYPKPVLEKAKRVSVSMLVMVAIRNREEAPTSELVKYKDYVVDASNISLGAKIVLLALLNMPKFTIKYVVHPILNGYIKIMHDVAGN